MSERDRAQLLESLVESGTGLGKGSVGMVMARPCELCSLPARMHCNSDRANLCWGCDARVHGANFIVARHSRRLLCCSCQALTPWSASGVRLGPAFSLCDHCLHARRGRGGDGVDLMSQKRERARENGTPERDEPDDKDDHCEDDDGEEEERNEGEEKEEDEDEDYQVVPLAVGTITPPATSCFRSAEEPFSLHGPSPPSLTAASSSGCVRAEPSSPRDSPSRALDGDGGR